MSPFCLSKGIYLEQAFSEYTFEGAYAKKRAVLFCLLKKGKWKSYFFNR